MKLVCQHCGKEFEGSRRDTKYCSQSCQAKASRLRRSQGINISEKICAKCGKKFIAKENAYNRRYCYECVPLVPKSGAGQRALIKKWALEYKGNKCEICGYNKCSEALDFHHLDPQEKDFNLSNRNLILDWQVIKKELDKCQLVCANCHREIHSKEKKGDD